MDDKIDKYKMLIFLINTMHQSLYVFKRASKDNPRLTKENMLVFIISTDKAAILEEEPDALIQELKSLNDLVIESDYPLYKIMALRDEDFIFDGQYSYHDNERISVAVLTKRELANLN